MTVTETASASTNAIPQIFFDETTDGDVDAHSALHEAVKNGSPPTDSLSGMPALQTSELSPQATPGQLSSAPAAQGGAATEGGTVYFGGFISNEGPQAVDGQAGTVHFFFEQTDEAGLISHLKEEKLITEDISSFSDLGAQAIGVIENAVDEGVLVVGEDGRLATGTASGESQQGASHVSRTNDAGQAEETANPLAKPKAERDSITTADGTTVTDEMLKAGGEMVTGEPIVLDGVEITPTISRVDLEGMNDLLSKLGIDPPDIFEPSVLGYLNAQKTESLIQVNDGVITVDEDNFTVAMTLLTNPGDSIDEKLAEKLIERHGENHEEYKQGMSQ